MDQENPTATRTDHGFGSNLQSFPLNPNSGRSGDSANSDRNSAPSPDQMTGRYVIPPVPASQNPCPSWSDEGCPLPLPIMSPLSIPRHNNSRARCVGAQQPLTWPPKNEMLPPRSAAALGIRAHRGASHSAVTATDHRPRSSHSPSFG